MVISAKKWKTVVVVFALFTLLIGITCFTTACQSTPEQEVVAQKGNDLLEKEIQKTALPINNSAQIDNDEKWEYEKEYHSGHRLIIDAMIKNNMTGLPVLSVREQPFESGEQIETIVRVFCPKAKVYDLGLSLTKSQIEEQIILYEKYLYQLQNEDDDRSHSLEIIGGYNPDLSIEEQVKASINQLKEEYENAPADSDLEESTYQLTEKGGSLQSNMKAVTNGHVVSFDFVNWDTPGSDFYMKNSDYLNAVNGTNIRDSFISPSSLYNDETFLKEKETTYRYIQDMGIDYMSLQTVCKNDIGYDYYYTRTVKGFPETYVKTYFGTQQTDQDGFIVMDLWKSEYVHIETQNGQVMIVEWKNPSEVINIDNDNVQILAWDQIKKIFLKQMGFILSPEPLSDVNGTDATFFTEATEININRIELGLTKVLMKDSQGEYKLIPTWSFMGYDANFAQEGVNTGAEICFLTINAIDGTVIDRGLMY